MTQAVATMFGDLLDRDVRKQFDRCWRAMWRDIDYLAGRDDESLVQAKRQGWSIERLRLLAVLNSFNRIVIGPLAAAYSTPTEVGLGQEIPITYGEHLEVSSRRAAVIAPALTAFEQLTSANGLKRHWLNMSRTADIVWMVGRTERDPGGDGGQETDA